MLESSRLFYIIFLRHLFFHANFHANFLSIIFTLQLNFRYISPFIFSLTDLFSRICFTPKFIFAQQIFYGHFLLSIFQRPDLFFYFYTLLLALFITQWAVTMGHLGLIGFFVCYNTHECCKTELPQLSHQPSGDSSIVSWPWVPCYSGLTLVEECVPMCQVT